MYVRAGGDGLTQPNPFSLQINPQSKHSQERDKPGLSLNLYQKEFPQLEKLGMFDLGAEEINVILSVALPAQRTPSVHFCLDLFSISVHGG